MSIFEEINKHFDETTIEPLDLNSDRECIKTNSTELYRLIHFLKTDNSFYFDYLTCISAIDIPESALFEIIYSLYSIPFDKHLDIKIQVENPGGSEFTKEVPSICVLFKSANWMEREVYDMFGIPFSNHPDLRRILMPADWVGFPLRRDYQTSEKYHGITIDYKEES